MKIENIWAAFRSSHRPQYVGYRRHVESDGTSTSGILWALYDRGAAEEEVGRPAKTGDTQFAIDLTGLYRTNSEYGSHFADDPEVRVSRNYVLIKQYGGRNI